MWCRLILTIAFASVAVGCSGGGGTSSPPTPPPPVNLAPELRYSVSTDQAVEGAVVVVDAQATTDPEGGRLTFSVTQPSGTPAQISEVNVGTFFITVPELGNQTSETLDFVISVEDDFENQSIGSFSILIESFETQGQLVARYEPSLDLRVGNTQRIGVPNIGRNSVIATRPTGSGDDDIEIVFFGTNLSGQVEYTIDNYEVVEGQFSDITQIRYRALTFNGVGGNNEFAVVNSDSDEIEWFYGDPQQFPQTFVKSDAINIENACFIEGRQNTAQDYVFVGHVEDGGSLVRITPIDDDGDGQAFAFDEEIIERFGEGRSLCYIFPALLPVSLVPDSIDGETVDFSDLVAIDYATNELVLFGDIEDDGTYEEVGVVPLETGTDEILSVVDVASYGTPSLAPRYMLILMTNGQHIGEHRLIAVTLDRRNDQEINQQVFSWNEGIPVAVVEGSFGSDRRGNQFINDAAVILGSSEVSLYFENIADRSNDTAAVPVYADPQPFTVGLGATSAVAAIDGGAPFDAVLVSFGATGHLVLFDPDPE